MINLGVLLGFNLTNTSLVLVRYEYDPSLDASEPRPGPLLSSSGPALEGGGGAYLGADAAGSFEGPASPASPAGGGGGGGSPQQHQQQPAVRLAKERAVSSATPGGECACPAANRALVVRCVACLWLFGVGAAYGTWWGFGRPYLQVLSAPPPPPRFPNARPPDHFFSLFSPPNNVC